MHEYALAAETLKRTLELNPPNASELKRFMAADLRRAKQFARGVEGLSGTGGGRAERCRILPAHVQHLYRSFAISPRRAQAQDKARAIEPNNLDVRYNEVTILKRKAKRPEAIDRLKEILDTTAKKNYSKDERGKPHRASGPAVDAVPDERSDRARGGGAAADRRAGS